MIAIIIGVALLGAVSAGPIMSNVEIPEYQVVKSQGSIEIRKYKPMIIAEVQMEGQRKEAINAGFRLLADYIFGNNTLEQDIAMTAPVHQQQNKKIAMTAPVEQWSSGNSWKVSFVMPSKYTMQDLPKPNNDRVVLKEVPSKSFVAILFSGMNSDENIDSHKERLLEYIQSHNLLIVGAPKYAFYNPPWTLPFMRRNEILIEIKQ